MANRYWVGGSGTWDNSSTANWSATSGGVSGASAPTSIDDVYFDSSSDVGVAFTVTLGTGAVCNYLSIGEFSALDQNMTLAGTSLSVYGSLLFPTSKLTCTYTGTLSFVSTVLGNTITTNGTSVRSIIINSQTGGWTLGSSINSSGIGGLSILACLLFDTAGYNMTFQWVNATSTNSVRNVYLRNSTVSDNGYYGQQWGGSGTTVYAGTSTIIAGNGFSANTNTTWNNIIIRALNSDGYIQGNNLTFNNITFENISGIGGFVGAVTCNNLVLSSVVTGGKTIFLSANLTINNSITAGSSTTSNRWLIASDVPHITRTITAGTTFLQNIDFRNIAAAGTIPWSGIGLGNCGGNSNITFNTPKTVYWNLAGSQNWNANGWALTSGGTPNTNNFPLPQDTCIFNDAGAAGTITLNTNYHIGNLDCSNRTVAMTINGSSTNTYLYGDFTLSSAVNITGHNTVGRWYFGGVGIQNLTTSGRGFNKGVVLDSVGTLRLQDNLTVLPAAYFGFNLTRGTLDLNNYILKSGVIRSDNTNTGRVINFGTGKIVTANSRLGSIAGSNPIAISGSKLIEYEDFIVDGVVIQAGGVYATKELSFNVVIRSVVGTAAIALQDYARFDNFTIADGITNPIKLGQVYTAIYGDLYIPNSVTGIQAATGLAGGFAFVGSDDHNITLPPVAVSGFLSVDTPSGTLNLRSSLTFTSHLTLTQGVLNLNGYNITGSSFNSSNSNARALNLGTSTITLTGTTGFNAATSANLTVQGPGTINLTSSSAKTFAGGSANYSGVILNQGGSGELTITGNNQFGGISNTVRPASIKFTANTTTTLDKFMFNGADGALVTISSTTNGTRYTLTSSAGVFAPYYTSVRDSNATGGAVWRAPTNYGNVNVSNNLGWDFSTINTLTDNFMVLFPSNLHLTS